MSSFIHRPCVRSFIGLDVRFTSSPPQKKNKKCLDAKKKNVFGGEVQSSLSKPPPLEGNIGPLHIYRGDICLLGHRQQAFFLIPKTSLLFEMVSQRLTGQVHRGVSERKGGRGRDPKKGEGGETRIEHQPSSIAAHHAAQSW